MSVADWVILAVIAISVAQAAMEGFFCQAFGIAGLVVGYLLAAWRYKQVAAWLEPHLKSPWVGDIAGFLLIFVGVLIVAGILGRFSRWVAKEAGLSFVDRLLGGVVGFVRGSLTVAIVLVAMTAFTPMSQRLEGSTLAPYFQVIGRAAIWVAPSELRSQFYRGLDLLGHQRGNEASSGPSPAKR